jgi:hypothetical protein
MPDIGPNSPQNEGKTTSSIVAEAQKFLGDPYVYGDAGPNAFDCSGLTSYVYKQLGITIPRTSGEQWNYGTPITQDQAQPGDLVFYVTDGSTSNPGHVAILAGGGNIIQAPHPGEDVEVSPLDDPGTPLGYRRMTKNTSILGGIESTIEGGLNDVTSGLSSLISWPSDIVGFFSTGTDALADVVDGFKLFFQPTTYIRLGAGFFGIFMLIAASIFLIREAKD